jgi:hypothetical protein
MREERGERGEKDRQRGLNVQKQFFFGTDSKVLSGEPSLHLIAGCAWFREFRCRTG